MKKPREIKKPLVKRVTRNNLERKVRRQTDELKVRSGQLRQGADREKIAKEQIYIRNKAMEAATDGIFIIDAKKSGFPVVYANYAFQSLTGYLSKEIIGKDYFSFYVSDAELYIVDEIKNAMQKGISFHGEMLSSRQNGKRFWSLLRIAPIRDEEGLTTHYVGIQTDMTLLKQRDLEIEEQREDLLHVTRVGKMAEFVSSLAHEISQPLTAILAYAQAAQRLLTAAKGGSEKETQLQEILQYIIADDQRAAEVILRLRALLKKNKPAFELLDINVLINDTVKLIMTHIIVRNKVIKFKLDSDLPLIKGDRIQLQQVLLNLISNSLEAMEESSVSRELMITTSRKDSETILVEVKDSGSGISKKGMNKLFTHFFTTKLNGLGMGLPISRSIVEAHHGRLDAVNNMDRGATFYFTLPVGVKGVL